MMKKTLLSLSIVGLLAASSATAQVALDTSAFSTELVGGGNTTNSITGFDISADSNALIVSVIGENYDVSSVTYNGGAQSFTQIGSTVESTDAVRKLSFWVLENPTDTAGTDIELTINSATFSGVYFAAWSLEEANVSSINLLSQEDSQDPSVSFTGLSAGSAVIDAVIQNTTTVPPATGQSRGTSYSANDFSGSGFTSFTGGLSGDVDFGANGDFQDLPFGAISIAAVPEPSTFALVGLAFGAVVLFRRRKS